MSMTVFHPVNSVLSHVEFYDVESGFFWWKLLV